MISELVKGFLHRGEPAPLYFWRDKTGREIDALVDLGSRLVAWEIKSAATVASDMFATLRWWQGLKGNPHRGGGLIYGGARSFRRDGFMVRSWRHLT